MKILSFSNPVWINAEHTAFMCDTKTDTFGDIPFTCVEHERTIYSYVDDLWQMVVEDPSVEIAPFVEPPPVQTATLSSGSIPGSVL
jgi:hypothetical protein